MFPVELPLGGKTETQQGSTLCINSFRPGDAYVRQWIIGLGHDLLPVRRPGIT